MNKKLLGLYIFYEGDFNQYALACNVKFDRTLQTLIKCRL
jgi:hypothetical protein